MFCFESQHSCAGIAQLISKNEGGGNFPGTYRLPWHWHRSFLLSSIFHIEHTLTMPLTKLPPSWSHGSHRIKLRAYSAFFSVPEIRCGLFPALGWALEAILVSLPNAVPQCVLTINSALLHYSLSKAQYCYLANRITKLIMLQFKRSCNIPSV